MLLCTLCDNGCAPTAPRLRNAQAEGNGLLEGTELFVDRRDWGNGMRAKTFRARKSLNLLHFHFSHSLIQMSRMAFTAIVIPCVFLSAAWTKTRANGLKQIFQRSKDSMTFHHDLRSKFHGKFDASFRPMLGAILVLLLLNCDITVLWLEKNSRLKQAGYISSKTENPSFKRTTIETTKNTFALQGESLWKSAFILNAL